MIGLLEKTQRKQLQLHFLEGEKFKTNLIGILIRVPLTRKNATKTALLAEVLKNGCSKYPSRTAVAIKNEGMYGSVFDISVLKKGEEQILFFYLELLKCNEDLLEEGFTFLKQFIREPLIENNGFLKDVVKREKVNLAKKIRGRKDDKKEYARLRCLEEMCEGEAFGIFADGYEEDLEEIDEQKLYDYYEDMLKHAPVELLFFGERDQKAAVKKMAEGFQFLSHEIWEQEVTKKKERRMKVKEVKEVMDVAQGRLCMGFSVDIAPQDKDFPALLAASEIFGGGPSSILFEQVREKEGLCYYVSSFVFSMKGIIFVQAGIGAENYQKTTEKVMNSLQEMQETKIEDQRLSEAKKSLISRYASIDDSPTAQMDFMIQEYLLQTRRTLPEFLKTLEDVTAEDVRRVARMVCPDTIYFLCGKEGEKNAGDTDGN